MKHLFFLALTVGILISSCDKCVIEESVINTHFTINTEFIDQERKYILDDSIEVYDSLGLTTTESINFHFNSILYQYADAGGKGIIPSSYVTIDNANKTYTYTTCIKMNNSPFGKKKAANDVAVVVPKIPSGYTVNFVVNKQNK